MRSTSQEIEKSSADRVAIVKNALSESRLDPVSDKLETWAASRACELYAAG